ncbi:SRPBCC family protein [Nocardioides sp. DS6]|uniref:SRPBCC family protein n=1 Tax=Nocardioides eburneus TaxID=3231482 RepID=A0ABV3T0V0_9ACTN
MSARYVFGEDWCVPAPPERVRDVLVDLEHFPEWWPQVRAVASLGPDDALVCCRSWLPYTLDLVLHAVSRELPTIEVSLTGGLDGFARWTITPDAGEGPGDEGGSRMVFEQEVTARGVVALVSPFARPVLTWNHARMMAGCRAGLVRRLARGQADSSVAATRSS